MLVEEGVSCDFATAAAQWLRSLEWNTLVFKGFGQRINDPMKMAEEVHRLCYDLLTSARPLTPDQVFAIDALIALPTGPGLYILEPLKSMIRDLAYVIRRHRVDSDYLKPVTAGSIHPVFFARGRHDNPLLAVKFCGSDSTSCHRYQPIGATYKDKELRRSPWSQRSRSSDPEREALSYLLEPFAVPMTLMIKLTPPNKTVPEIATVQRWVEGEHPNHDAKFKGYIEEVQRLACLDILIANTDRHSGNIIQATDGRPVPIDHGISFGGHSTARWLWNDWSHVDEPLCDPLKQEILNSSPQATAALLADFRLDHESIFAFLLRHKLLKAAAGANLTLHQIIDLLPKVTQLPLDEATPQTFDALIDEHIADLIDELNC